MSLGILVGELGIGTVGEGGTKTGSSNAVQEDGPDGGVGRENEYGGRCGEVVVGIRKLQSTRAEAAHVRTVAVVASRVYQAIGLFVMLVYTVTIHSLIVRPSAQTLVL